MLVYRHLYRKRKIKTLFTIYKTLWFPAKPDLTTIIIISLPLWINVKKAVFNIGCLCTYSITVFKSVFIFNFVFFYKKSYRLHGFNFSQTINVPQKLFWSFWYWLHHNLIIHQRKVKCQNREKYLKYFKYLNT